MLKTLAAECHWVPSVDLLSKGGKKDLSGLVGLLGPVSPVQLRVVV
jgi:hypothetical protein